LWRVRRAVDWAVPAFLAVVTLSLLAGLHWTEYRFLARRLGPFNSGRYLLPLVGIAGLTLAQAIRRLRPQARGVAVAGVLGGLFVLNLYSLGLMLVRFYA
jgi:ABC-type transport system involved in cytochrome c biogenesis permease subunit